MVTEIRVQNQAQQLYVRALSMAYRARTQVYDPSIWLIREPEIEEKMLRDPDIAHAVQYRRHLIAGRQWTVLPVNSSSPKAELAVAIATQALQCLRSFTSARLALARAFFSGARFARIRTKRVRKSWGDGKVRDWIVPEMLIDEDKRSYRLVPDHKDGDPIHTHWERWNVSKSEWQPVTHAQWETTICHVYDDDSSSLGYGRALREALGWLWYAKENIFAESLQAVERFSQGIITAKLDGVRDAATGKPNVELIRQWQEVLANVKSSNVLIQDSADQIEMIHPSGTGWQMMTEMRAELRNQIMTLVIGSNLSTSADKGGSYALAEVQENSTEALIQYDRENLEQTLTEDLIGFIWRANWANIVELGIAEDMPRFNITQDKRQEPEERAASAVALAGVGLPLAVDDLYEQTGFRKPEEGEELLEVPKPEPMGIPGMPGIPGAPGRQPLTADLTRGGLGDLPWQST